MNNTEPVKLPAVVNGDNFIFVLAGEGRLCSGQCQADKESSNFDESFHGSYLLLKSCETRRSAIHQLSFDIFHDIPNLLVFQGFSVGHHARTLRSVLNDPEHLPGGDMLHGVRAGKIPGLGIQGQTQFAVTLPLEAMAHLASHGLGGFLEQGFPSFSVCIGRNGGFCQVGRCRGRFFAVAGRVQIFLLFQRYLRQFGF